MSTGDATSDMVLRWEFGAQDMRKLNIWMPRPNEEDLKLYYFSHFDRLSTYYRFNLLTGRYENAGNVEWNSVRNIRLNLGLRSLPVDTMTYKNKASSKLRDLSPSAWQLAIWSRRFKAMNNIEYKWRPVESNPVDLECVTVAGKKFVALYTAADTTLRVHSRGQPVLDDIVILSSYWKFKRILSNYWPDQQGQPAAKGADRPED